MKYTLLLLLCLNTTINLNSGDDKTSPETLGKIANLVGHFGNVLANPNDPKAVATSICSIVANILGMAADTRSISSLDTQEKILDILEKGKKEDIAKLKEILKELCDIQIKSLDKFVK